MEESGRLLKSVAVVIAVSLTACAYFILKADPVKVSSPERAAAIQTVKNFAKYIEDNPSFPNISVHSISQPSLRTKNFAHSDFSDELQRRIKAGEIHHPQFLPFLIEHQAELSEEMKAFFSEKTLMRNTLWETKMEVLRVIFKTPEFTEELKSESLKTFSLELVSAREDPIAEVQKKVEQWAEEYVKFEHRPAFKNAFIAAFHERKVQTHQKESPD